MVLLDYGPFHDVSPEVGIWVTSCVAAAGYGPSRAFVLVVVAMVQHYDAVHLRGSARGPHLGRPLDWSHPQCTSF